MTLTEQEAIVLEIMSAGEDMLAVGNWEDTILGLAKRGLCEKVLYKWHRITSKGLAEFEAFERAENAPVVDVVAEET